MVGIYKITNKLNGKSYIGQSIHCGKRLDEHSKGSQFIDEIIQIEGIENFQFEILKEVERNELNYWEDYYIIEYNTLFPNGYNKKMNNPKHIQKKIKGKDRKIRVIADDRMEKHYSKITDKQWSVYFYFVSNSLQDFTKEKRRFVDKKEVNITAASKYLGITRTTFYKAVSQLEQYNLITFDEYYYYISNPKTYVETHLETIIYLLKYRKYMGIDLLRTYILLKKLYVLYKDNERVKSFTRKEIIDLLGHDVSSSQYYSMVETYLSLLERWNLIILEKQTIASPTGRYILYTLIDVKDKSLFTEQEHFNIEKELLAAGITVKK